MAVMETKSYANDKNDTKPTNDTHAGSKDAVKAYNSSVFLVVF